MADRRDFLRIGLFTTSALAVGNLISACDNTAPTADRSASPPPKPTGVLRIANNGEPTTLDPSRTSGAVDHAILWHNIYEPLVGFKPDSADLVGILAQEYTSTPDARQWTFTLRPGITFHDGEPLTSTAVKQSLEYYLASPSYLALLIPKGATVDDSDPAVVRISSNTPMPDLARNLASLFIISPKLVRAGADAVAKTPSGTGPFRFVSYQTTRSVILEANQSYRGPGPYLERLEYAIIPDADARVAALRSGTIDVVTDLAATNASALASDREIVVTRRTVWQVTKLFLFTKTPPLDNVTVRQALAHAIDRQTLLKTIAGDAGQVDDSWVPIGVYGHQKPQTSYPHDLAKARQLLASSGQTLPVKLVLALVEGSSLETQRMTQAIASMANEAGFEATVETVPATKYGNALNSPPDTKPWHGIVSYWGNPTGGVGFFADLGLMKSTLQFDDPQFTALATQAATLADGPERMNVYQQMENRVAELAPSITLYTRVQTDAHSGRVNGYRTTNFGSDPSFAQVFV